MNIQVNFLIYPYIYTAAKYSHFVIVLKSKMEVANFTRNINTKEDRIQQILNGTK